MIPNNLIITRLTKIIVRRFMIIRRFLLIDSMQFMSGSVDQKMLRIISRLSK